MQIFGEKMPKNSQKTATLKVESKKTICGGCDGRLDLPVGHVPVLLRGLSHDVLESHIESVL